MYVLAAGPGGGQWIPLPVVAGGDIGRCRHCARGVADGAMGGHWVMGPPSILMALPAAGANADGRWVCGRGRRQRWGEGAGVAAGGAATGRPAASIRCWRWCDAVNQDGVNGLTAPNGLAQQRVSPGGANAVALSTQT